MDTPSLRTMWKHVAFWRRFSQIKKEAEDMNLQHGKCILCDRQLISPMPEESLTSGPLIEERFTDRISGRDIENAVNASGISGRSARPLDVVRESTKPPSGTKLLEYLDQHRVVEPGQWTQEHHAVMLNEKQRQEQR